jgi:hypothetical protein
MAPPPAQWAPSPTPEERAAELRDQERALTRAIWLSSLGAIGGCLASLVIALALMGWALHTNDPGYGSIAFFGGLVVGYAGIAVSLARFYIRGENDGWW